MFPWFPHSLALFSRLGPWYRYTVSFPVFTCLSISFFQWWIREAGQMIRVPLDTTMLESRQWRKTKDYLAVSHHNIIKKKIYLPVLEIHFSSFFSSFFSSSSFALTFLASMREMMVKVFPRPMSSAEYRESNKNKKHWRHNNYNVKYLR